MAKYQSFCHETLPRLVRGQLEHELAERTEATSERLISRVPEIVRACLNQAFDRFQNASQNPDGAPPQARQAMDPPGFATNPERSPHGSFRFISQPHSEAPPLDDTFRAHPWLDSYALPEAPIVMRDRNSQGCSNVDSGSTWGNSGVFSSTEFLYLLNTSGGDVNEDFEV